MGSKVRAWFLPWDGHNYPEFRVEHKPPHCELMPQPV